MSDDDPTLSPEQEREVRRLLADARHAEPIPGDVAERLDRVLAELAGGESLDATPVTSLAARRRQRVVSLLVAAAAVVVLGVGLGQVVGTRSGSEDSAGSDTAGAARELATPRDGAENGARNGAQDNRAASGSARLPEAYAAQPRYALDHPVTVHVDRFSRDVTRLRDLTAGRLDSTLSSATEDSVGGLTGFSLECPAADWGAGTFVPVRYAGDPGVLVFRRAVGDTQVVDLFQCGSAEVVRSITLPAP